MTDLIPFTFENQQMRVIDRDTGPWFVASDVAAILGYDHTPSMVRNLDDDEADVHIVHSSSQNREMSIISESGLYNAIFKSRRAEAKAFRRWVTGTVLPQIRRTGRFDAVPWDLANAHEPPPLTNAAFLSAATAVVREARRLFGEGVARVIWTDIGLPLPTFAMPAIDDGMAEAVRIWTNGRTGFTNDELAAGLGLGAPDMMLRRRMGDILRALGFVSRKTRRGYGLVNAWHPTPPHPSTVTVEAGEA